MEWISVNNTDKEIPFSKVCIYDGANTFWAYLQEVIITNDIRKLNWVVSTPDNYGECIPLYWIKIEYPHD